jgi:hypothetical protein
VAKHELKIWPEFFDAIVMGRKKFEVRKDIGFNVGDVLYLQSWDPVKNEYTGSFMYAQVIYKLDGGQFGIEPGYCVLGIQPW